MRRIHLIENVIIFIQFFFSFVEFVTLIEASERINLKISFKIFKQIYLLTVDDENMNGDTNIQSTLIYTLLLISISIL